MMRHHAEEAIARIAFLKTSKIENPNPLENLAYYVLTIRVFAVPFPFHQ